MDGALPAGAWPDHEQQALLILPGLVHSQLRVAEAECPGLPVGSTSPGAVAMGAAMTHSIPPAPGMGALGEREQSGGSQYLKVCTEPQAFSLLKNPCCSYPHFTDEETAVPNAHWLHSCGLTVLPSLPFCCQMPSWAHGLQAKHYISQTPLQQALAKAR